MARIHPLSLPMPSLLVLAVVAIGAALAEEKSGLPAGFTYLDEVAPTIASDLRYASTQNFVGSRIDGYEGSRVILTQKAARALQAVQAELAPSGLGLKVYDAYRPKRAVAHFVRWARGGVETGTKATYYPRVRRQDLFAQGYIARYSGHSRGSTVDLTLVELAGGKELPMGTTFDFLDPRSGYGSREVTAEARANRAKLRTVMVKHGFRSLPKEWWHFRLADEPFPKTYFDFPVK